MTARRREAKKPYIILETKGSDTKQHTLNDDEWNIIEEIFKNHPELITIKCPYRDIDE